MHYGYSAAGGELTLPPGQAAGGLDGLAGAQAQPALQAHRGCNAWRRARLRVQQLPIGHRPVRPDPGRAGQPERTSRQRRVAGQLRTSHRPETLAQAGQPVLQCSRADQRRALVGNVARHVARFQVREVRDADVERVQPAKNVLHVRGAGHARQGGAAQCALGAVNLTVE